MAKRMIVMSRKGGKMIYYFPTVHGKNLEGQEFTLPRDFEQKRNLLVIAFKREQQHDSETWTPLLKRLTDEYPDLAFYELPVLTTFSPLRRLQINNGMRSAIADQGARHATITLYLEKEPFKHVLGIPDEESISLMLVDQAGTIFWRTPGAWSQEKERDLTRFLQQTP